MRRDEVLKNGKAIHKVGQDRVFDNRPTRVTRLTWFSHQAPQTAQLLNLLFGTTCTRVKHHEHRVEALLVAGQLTHQCIGNAVVRISPTVDDLVVTLVVRNQTHVVVVPHFVYFTLRFFQCILLDGRRDQVTKVEGQTTAEGPSKAHVFDVVEEIGCHRKIGTFDYFTNYRFQVFLGHQGVLERYTSWHYLIEQHPSYSRFRQFFDYLAVHFYRNTYFDFGVQVYLAFIEGNDHLFRRVELHTFPFHDDITNGFTLFGNVVQTQYHVLRRQGNWCTVLRVEHVVRRKHQHLSFQNRRLAQGYVYRHLVTVEVGVERATHQWVQLDRLAFYQTRLEGLDRQTVQSWGTVEEHGVPLQDIFEDFPDYRILTVYKFFCRFNRFHDTALDEFADDEGFEQFGSHPFGQTTLVQFQGWAYYDY